MILEEMREKAELVTKSTVEALGYELVELKCEYKNKSIHLTYYIYSPNGIGYDDCIKLSSAVSPILDNEDISNGKSYNLNVSSPGLDRLIETDDDLRRNLGVKVVALYRDNREKTRKSIGILEKYDEEILSLLDQNNKQIKILKSSIIKLRAHISFKK